MSAEFFACKTTAILNDHNGDEAAHFLANINNSCAHCPHFATTFSNHGMFFRGQLLEESLSCYQMLALGCKGLLSI